MATQIVGTIAFLLGFRFLTYLNNTQDEKSFSNETMNMKNIYLRTC